MIDEATFKSPITPSGDRLVVVRVHQKQKGSVFLTETAQEKPAVGVLLAKGIDVRENFKNLSFLLFGRYSGIEQEIAGVLYVILREDEVIGTLADDAAIKEYDVDVNPEQK